MTSWIKGALTGAVMAMGTTGVLAQTATTPATDWSVFTGDNPKECWSVSPPKQTVNTRDSKPVSVKRSDILLFVTFRPGQAGGETSFTGGYPFAPGSTVELNVDGTKFNMIADGEWAWASGVDDDAKILASLQKGASAVLKAHSAKGTNTEDTFSLRGFTAAATEAASRCK